MGKRERLLDELKGLEEIQLTDDDYWMGNREFTLVTDEGAYKGFAGGEAFGEIFGPLSYEDLAAMAAEGQDGEIDCERWGVNEEAAEVIGQADFVQELASAQIDRGGTVYFTYSGNISEGEVTLLFGNDKYDLKQELYKQLISEGFMDFEAWDDMEVDVLEEWAEKLDILLDDEDEEEEEDEENSQ